MVHWAKSGEKRHRLTRRQRTGTCRGVGSEMAVRTVEGEDDVAKLLTCNRDTLDAYVIDSSYTFDRTFHPKKLRNRP